MTIDGNCSLVRSLQTQRTTYADTVTPKYPYVFKNHYTHQDSNNHPPHPTNLSIPLSSFLYPRSSPRLSLSLNLSLSPTLEKSTIVHHSTSPHTHTPTHTPHHHRRRKNNKHPSNSNSIPIQPIINPVRSIPTQPRSSYKASTRALYIHTARMYVTAEQINPSLSGIKE